ncbi:hypothetical protein DFJ73DRAFT_143080 [Zopfochytrium polystomum]|nr:hypothetical protein DFJ73DRAFT_143080 [Zopfochytrium polystomum]
MLKVSGGFLWSFVCVEAASIYTFPISFMKPLSERRFSNNSILLMGHDPPQTSVQMHHRHHRPSQKIKNEKL